MVPSFPTKTFPNHYSIATGLLPAHHGIVANTMVDSVLGRFTTADTIVNRKPGWWLGEPIWITAERQGRRAATMFWVGSEVAYAGRRPTFWRSFDAYLPSQDRVDQVLAWLALPDSTRPALVTLYLNRVDVMGHRFGPDHPAVDSAIAVVDSAVGRVLDGIDRLGLATRTDVIVVSDHGMTGISPERIVFLDDYVRLDPAEVVDLAPVTALDPAPGRLDSVYRALVGAHPHLRVYRRDETPDRYRFRTSPRITPLVAVADDGWTLALRSLWKQRPFTDRGNHGYDNALTSMSAVFLAAGPDFKSGATIAPFQNIHVYSLVAHLLGIRPAPNDGTLDSLAAALR